MKLEEFINQIDEYQDQIKSLKKQLELKDNMYNLASHELDQLKITHSSTLLKSDRLDEENKKLEEEIEKYQKKLQSSQNTIKENNAKIYELNDQIEKSNKKIDTINNTINQLSHEKSGLSSLVSSLQADNEKLLCNNKTLEAENESLMEVQKSLNKKELESDDFDRDLELPSEDLDRKNMENIIVCKTVKHENKTWCLIYLKNQNPEYKWYERYILQDLNSSIDFPPVFEEELQQKISELTEASEELSAIKSLRFPEDLKKESLIESIESLIKTYTSRRSSKRPIKVVNDDDEFGIPVSGLPNIDSGSRISDNFSESSVKVTAEEAGQFFIKMKNLEEENMELENRILLLNQQLAYFRTEGNSSNFSGRSDANLDQIQSITLSLIEKLPVQTSEVESNIKVVLDIMNLNKEQKDKLNEIREKKSPKKVSGFKKLFSKGK
jgi:hypothetical protein